MSDEIHIHMLTKLGGLMMRVKMSSLILGLYSFRFTCPRPTGQPSNLIQASYVDIVIGRGAVSGANW
jgi:hypothetical protein